MDFKVLKLGENHHIDMQVLTIINEALQLKLNFGDLVLMTDSDMRGSIYTTFLIGHRVASVNFFIPFYFTNGLEEKVYYQSGFSATCSDFKGKGLWTKLMAQSESYLFQNNASMIFGFPNSVSFPIFKQKLDYSQSNFDIHFGIPLIFILVRLFNFTNNNSDHIRAYNCDYRQILDWHKRKNGLEIVEMEYNSAKLWGKIRQKSFLSLSLNYFEIGGYQGESKIDLKTLLMKSMLKYKFYFVVYLSTKPDLLTKILFQFKKYKQPFIYKTIMVNDTLFERSRFLGGIRDVF
jgi:hypothetical protein